MTPDRKTIVSGRKIEEFYWARKMVVYIDNHATEETYEEAIKRLGNLNRKASHER